MTHKKLNKNSSFIPLLFKITYFSSSLALGPFYLLAQNLHPFLKMAITANSFITATYLLVLYWAKKSEAKQSFNIKLGTSLLVGLVLTTLTQVWLQTNSTDLSRPDYFVGIFLVLCGLGPIANCGLDFFHRDESFALIPQGEPSKQNQKRQLGIIAAYFFYFFLFIQGIFVWI